MSIVHESLDESIDGQGSEAPRPEQDDAWMTSRRILSQIREFHIEGEQNSLFPLGGVGNDRIGLRQQSFFLRRRHFVPESCQSGF